MSTRTVCQRVAVISVSLILLLFFSTGTAWAHCDRQSGPVAVDARKALETGKYELVAIWIGTDQEKELRAKFDQSLSVYQKGGEAKILAEYFFVETAVRLHRAAEGMPFDGLKPAASDPLHLATADKALQTGKLKPVTNLLSAEMEKEAEKLFKQAMEAKKSKDESVKKGRQWVDAYVKYIVYINGLYKTIQAGPEHGVD